MQAAQDALLGREAERDRITGFLDARSALPGALVIEGEAGAGKTSLWRAGVSHAREAGYRVLACRPAGAEVQLSFAGLGDLLDGELDDVLPALPGPQRRAVEFALLLHEDHGRPPEHRAIAAGVLGLLRAMARQSPVLVAIDDVHWLDAPSASVLAYVLRRLDASPVAVLAAWRTGTSAVAAAARIPGLDLERLMDAPPDRLVLGPLSLGAIQRIVRTRTGLDFNRRTLQQIHETSVGNPFYALELVRALERGVAGWVPGEPLPLTLGLQDLLAERQVGLDGPTRDALVVSAAASHPTLDLIAQVFGEPADELLAPALAAAIVRIDRGRIVFTHPLLAASCYGIATPVDRRRWHGRLAAVATDPESRARHMALATERPDHEVARSLLDGARHARDRGALAAAADLYWSAIDWLPPSASRLRAEWAVEAAPTLRSAGETQRARQVLTDAIRELPASGLRSDALLLLSGIVAVDPGGSAREMELIDAALQEAGADPRRRAAALLRREMWERHRDRFAAALPVAREAVALAERARDDHLLARALTRTADLEVLSGLAADPVEHFQRALRVGAAFRFDSRDDAAPSMLAACLIRAGRVTEARGLLAEERQRATADGDEASLEILHVFLAELEWLAGDWASALALAEEGRDIAERAGSRTMEGALDALTGLIEASRGEASRARSDLMTAVGLCEAVGDVSYTAYARQMLGFLELSLGDAAATLRWHGSPPLEHGIEGTKRLSFIGDEIEALVQLARYDDAATLADELARRGAALRRPTLSATAARGRGLVLGSRGEHEAATSAAAESVVTFAALGLPFETARSLVVLGEVQRRAKRRGDARDTLGEAIAKFEALGATLWAEKARTERARIGGRTAVSGLTETELQVARLVAQGLSNKEIAAQLFVTVRAVEANLSRIYAKLAIRSRTELARRF